MRDIIIIGAGGHSKVIVDSLLSEPGNNILGFIDDNKPKDMLHYGYPVLGDEGVLEDVKGAEIIVAIGDNWIRRAIVERLQKRFQDIVWARVIHPSAKISRTAAIGEGTVVMPGAIINADAKIGSHCIINTGAVIEHDCRISNFVAVQPGAVVGGESQISEMSVVSLGASVIHGIKIGENTVIGAGAVVVNDIGSDVVAVGVPAKELRSRRKGEGYL